jgi:hypothetical protein
MGFDKNKKVIKILVIVIVVLVIFAGYLILVNNSKFKIKADIGYIFNKADSALELSQSSPIMDNILNNKAEITNRIVAKVSLSDDVMESIGPAGKSIENLNNNSTITTDIKSDVASKYMDMAVNYSYNNEEIVANAYVDNNQVYLLLKNYFDKYIKFDTKSINTEKVDSKMIYDINIDDIRYLMDILKKSVVDGIDYGEITNAKDEIDIDEDKLNVNKTTLIIDTKLKNQITTILLNKILMDSKAKEIILKLVDKDKYPDVSYLEEDIRKTVLNMQTTNYDNVVLGEFSVYTSGIFSKVVRNEFKSYDLNKAVIQYTTYKTKKFDTQISIYENNALFSQANIKEISKDNYDITMTYGQNMSMDIKGIISDSTTDINYTVRISGLDDIKGDVKVERKNISKDEINQTFTARLNTPESYGTVNLTIDSTFKTIGSITKQDFTNSVNSLTNEQTMNIMTNFQNKNPKLIKAITDIINGFMEK